MVLRVKREKLVWEVLTEILGFQGHQVRQTWYSYEHHWNILIKGISGEGGEARSGMGVHYILGGGAGPRGEPGEQGQRGQQVNWIS